LTFTSLDTPVKKRLKPGPAQRIRLICILRFCSLIITFAGIKLPVVASSSDYFYFLRCFIKKNRAGLRRERRERNYPALKLGFF